MIVLGIDPGITSGWGLATDHETIVDSGVATTAADRSAVIWRALDLAQEAHRLRVAIEWPTAGGGGARTALGIGKSRGRWLEMLELLAGYPEGRVLRLQPRQWRAATHGVVTAKGDTRAEREAHFKRAACTYTGIVHPDEAEGCCIALHGAALVASEAA